MKAQGTNLCHYKITLMIIFVIAMLPARLTNASLGARPSGEETKQTHLQCLTCHECDFRNLIMGRKLGMFRMTYCIGSLIIGNTCMVWSETSE